ncbi:hypothetical protein LPTSP3_g04220 [Leptospira kobayashii]|uniref:Uncharacterized protein n=1 Tax=Leptospira kobayashii TaxID=1917830 RepID=A0ABN6K986_9LEPT|nr:hypothetical protein LPTSP3_g04220 [Leptospira kobayashii]
MGDLYFSFTVVAGGGVAVVVGSSALKERVQISSAHRRVTLEKESGEGICLGFIYLQNYKIRQFVLSKNINLDKVIVLV